MFILVRQTIDICVNTNIEISNISLLATTNYQLCINIEIAWTACRGYYQKTLSGTLWYWMAFNGVVNSVVWTWCRVQMALNNSVCNTVPIYAYLAKKTLLISGKLCHLDSRTFSGINTMDIGSQMALFALWNRIHYAIQHHFLHPLAL